jgi:site-specific DNA recombinase
MNMGTKALTKRVRDEVAGGRKRAVYYLRVSTPAQVNTDYNPEGISLPAQREATERKERELGADNVGEYVEPGRTATSIERRPVFQEMLARIRAERDVDYIVVYAFSRLFRNSTDAALVKRELKALGVRIVSATEYLEDNPTGDLVETILHAVNTYQSEANGADIRYKMSQKAKVGGTITKAPLGYLNQRIDVDGRNVAVSVKDPDRAAHLLHGFELYATGQYSGREVLDRITAAGLVTRGTKRRAPQPLSLNQFYVILSDRYYTGVIDYDGEEYPGRHEALVTPELFDRVQRVLALHGGGGIRQRTHNHYLKGILWCGRCGRRFVIMPGRGNGGTYFYYICRGRQGHGCDQPYLRIEAVEAAVTRHYATVRLSQAFQTGVRGVLDDALLGGLGSLAALKKRLTGRLEVLSTKEDHYLELVGTAGWPKEKLRRKLDAIQVERDQIAEQLTDTTTRLTAGRAYFLAALALLRDPQGFYDEGGTSLKRAMNKIVFSKLFVDGQAITGHELGETVRDVIQADSTMFRWDGQAVTTSTALSAKGQNASSPAGEGEAAWLQWTKTDLLVAALSGHGSSRAVMVGDTGIEPVTSSV